MRLLTIVVVALGAVTCLAWSLRGFDDRPGAASRVVSPTGLVESLELYHPPLLGVLRDRIVVIEAMRPTIQTAPIGPRAALTITPLELSDGSVVIPRADGVWIVSSSTRDVKRIAVTSVRQVVGELSPGSVLAVADLPSDSGRLRSQLVTLSLADGSVKVLAKQLLGGRVLSAAFDAERRQLGVATLDPANGASIVHIMIPDGSVLRSRRWHVPLSNTVPISFDRTGGALYLTEWPREDNHATGIARWESDKVEMVARALKAGLPLGARGLVARRGDFECWLVAPDRSASCLLRATEHPSKDCGAGTDLQASADGRYIGSRLHSSRSEYGAFVIDAQTNKFCRIPAMEQLRWLRSAVWAKTSTGH